MYITHLLVGQHGRQRWQNQLGLWPLVIALVFAALQMVQTYFGLMDATDASVLIAFYLLSYGVLYLSVRQGWGLRQLGKANVLMLQLVLAIVAVAWSYAITHAGRGVLLGLPVLALAYGMFGLAAAQIKTLSWATLALVGGTMLWKGYAMPRQYPVLDLVTEWVGLAIMLLAVMALAGRTQAFRDNYRKQKKALGTAQAQLNLLATHDELTGLPNRRHMNVLMKSELVRQKRTAQAMSLVMVNIDQFKTLNDGLGRAGGDALLQGFAQVMAATLRGSDLLARWGGDEFLLMLPDTSPLEAKRCVERVREALAAYSLAEISPDLTMSFAAGLTGCPPGEVLSDAIKRTEQAMYQAGAQGRGQTALL